MTRSHGTAPSDAGTEARRTWTVPQMRRLATSEAEFNASTRPDNEGMS